MQDARGVWRRACGHSSVRNRRDPSRRPTLGVGSPYKLMVKGGCVGRESEGFVVPWTLVERPVEGRDPALVVAASGGKREGMVARPNHPTDKVRELQRSLFKAAKCHRERRFHALFD